MKNKIQMAMLVFLALPLISEVWITDDGKHHLHPHSGGDLITKEDAENYVEPQLEPVAPPVVDEPLEPIAPVATVETIITKQQPPKSAKK